ncbi:MAG TPA: aromatic ring-hydroxylating dioxygenase subunit alpha [Candidatus Limnocylindria bacterium]|nr:aromatic ring-hydroxylating dioxygenase subunit alpha [Candidatus Limnocylindria bacterium]
MLSEAKNRQVTQVGAGTPMGDLLRRYWMPIAAVSEFDETAIKPVRLLGEDLVLYKDLGGTYGLVDRRCPHRRADLSYGFVERCGLRCNYHGWLYDEGGTCLEQPYDDLAHPESRFKEKITIKAYPVEAKSGLLWAYLGPQPVPLVPTYEPFTWEHGFKQIVISEIPCNWFQCQENSIDPVHFEWMHRNWSVRLRGEPGPYAAKHVRVAFDEFEHGFVYRRILEDTDESDALWTVGRVCLWPNALFTGDHFEWRVPIDDERTLSVTWHFSRVPKEREPYVQERIPVWFGPITDPLTGRWITSHVMNQDFVAWLGQGEIADRTQEHLGASDRGITMIRKRFFEDMEAIARGEDPKAIVRDPAANVCIPLPVVSREMLVEGLTLEELRTRSGTGLNGYIFQAGQPAQIRHAFEAAMGIAGATREHR